MISKIFIKSLLPSVLVIGMATAAIAQEVERPQPTVWFGASVGANFNYYTGTTQTLNSAVKAPAAFHKGFGVGPYVSALFEYRPKPMWGFMLNVAYDGRGGAFDGVMAPCECPEELSTKLSYLTIEESVRFAPFSSKFYLFLGGAFSYNLNKSFEYTQLLKQDKSGDFSDVKSALFSGQIGAGYEIPLSAVSNPTQINLSPFISYHPYFGQDPRSIESWSLSTLRVGIALKFGKAKPKVVSTASVTDGGVQFSVRAPLTVPVMRKVKEAFPLRNSVFFDEGSSAIPSRYIALNKEDATNFREGKFQEPEPKDVNGRSDRQLTAYYNILNILGDRMRKDPNSTITLTGASAGKGPEVGKQYAESVKNYLVTVYGISGTRITTEGRDQPVNPSEQPGATKELVLLREGDRRVDIVGNPPSLLAPLQISVVEPAPVDSRIVFKNDPGAKQSLKTWSLEVKDENGKVQNYGPYTSGQESISGNTILGDRKEGNYKVVMTGQTNEGTTITKESNLHLVRDAQPAEEAIRFSILFDFDKSKAVTAYDKFLTETVAPLVTDNATVIIHGHSDIIGDEGHNVKLSEQRADDAKRILERAVTKAGKKGVKYEVFGFGAEADAAPFENKLPEERFYNRTVIIDIVPKK